MTDLTPHTSPDIDAPETPYERGVCKTTLFSSVIFLLSAAYYFLSPERNSIAYTITIVSGVVFAVCMVNFFVAAFCGKLCGKGKEQ